MCSKTEYISEKKIISWKNILKVIKKWNFEILPKIQFQPFSLGKLPQNCFCVSKIVNHEHLEKVYANNDLDRGSVLKNDSESTFKNAGIFSTCIV